MAESGDELHVTEGDTTLPAIDVLTGRGFVTGKSGSGKSNTASVLVEELLDHESRLLIVDTDGEYYGLKEEYEVLHLGASDRCDAVVGPADAEAIADVALAEGVPVILDVSGFLEGDDADRLVYEVTKQLFSQARDVRQPFLLLVEEVHEFVPEQGGLGDVGEMLVRIAKRGRKRGLGLCGLSQRPASVDKDFITQCDWIVWHRLTWANDTRVVDQILGGSYSTDVESLGDGEAFLVADWEQQVERVQFRRKHTYDAGATPGYGEETVPDLRPVDDAWLERFRDGEASDDDPASGDAPADSDGTADSGSAATDDADGSAAGDADADGAGDDAGDGSADSSAGGSAAESSADSDSPGRSTGGSQAGRSTGGAGSGAASRRSASGGSPPPADARTAVWELGQLVAHLARVAGRRTARGLYTGGLFAVRSTDAGLRRLGYRARDVGSRAFEAFTGESASSPVTTGDDGPVDWRPDTRENPVADRFVGVSLVLVVLLFGYAAYALA